MCACFCASTRESQRKTEKMQANDKQHNNYSHENEMNKTQIKSSNREKEEGKKRHNCHGESISFIHTRKKVEGTQKQNYDHKKIEVCIAHIQTLTKAPEISANSVHTQIISHNHFFRDLTSIFRRRGGWRCELKRWLPRHFVLTSVVIAVVLLPPLSSLIIFRIYHQILHRDNITPKSTH